MSLIQVKINQLLQAHDPSDVLLVLDIDNTLLTSVRDLGGDAWFSWQEMKLKNGDKQDLVAADFDGLLRVQGLLFGMGQMRPPEMETPSILRDFQSQGVPVLLLTSRGANFQNSTERELSRNGYNFVQTAPGPTGGYAGHFLPYDFKQPEASCLSRTDLQAWGLKNAVPSVYANGVFYTSGQHKGAMLRSLLCKIKKHYPVIVFIDDLAKHVDRVELAYKNEPEVNVISIRYGKMDEKVAEFERSNKHEVIEGWGKIKTVLSEVLGAEF